MKYLLLVCVLLTSCVEIDNGPADMQTMKESRPIGDAKELTVHLTYDVGTLEVRPLHGGDLFDLNLEYDARRTSPHFSFTGSDRANLTLSTDSHSGFRFNRSRHSSDMSLRLNDTVPLDLDVSTGVSDSHIDLTDLDIEQLRLRGGVGRTDVAIDHPVKKPMSRFDVESGVGNLTVRGLGNARLERLTVHGGVGRTELDFSGDLKDTRTDAEIDVGVGQVRLLLPREAGITIEAEGSFLSNISAPSFDKNGNTYVHRGVDNAPNQILIRVRSGVGGVTVELI